MQKLVDNNHYHLWTDALHARALAHQANNKWDRGTYIRWTLTTAWTVLEIACQDALEESNISYRFKENLDDAIASKSLSKINWSHGIWQKVRQTQEIRKDYVHRFALEKDLFPEAELADNVIQTIREAIKDIYARAGKVSPKWLDDDDDDRGWDRGRDFGANLTVIRAGADENDPDAIKIAYVYKDREYVSEILAPNADWRPYYEGLIRNIRGPISLVKVYRGSEVIEERNLQIRGS